MIRDANLPIAFEQNSLAFWVTWNIRYSQKYRYEIRHLPDSDLTSESPIHLKSRRNLIPRKVVVIIFSVGFSLQVHQISLCHWLQGTFQSYRIIVSSLCFLCSLKSVFFLPWHLKTQLLLYYFAIINLLHKFVMQTF